MSSFFDKYRAGDTPSIGTARDMGRVAPRSSVDAARTNDENKRHWGNADGLGPNAAFNEGTRQKLRNRGRYEALNSSFCRGLVRSLAYDLIGTGPRPQLGIPGDKDGTAAKSVEANYAKWARAVGLGRKYRIMEKSDARCGEVFGLLNTNLRIKNPVKLDLRLLEAEQCTTPPGVKLDPFLVDGIQYDENWAPLEYYFLKYHPGEINWLLTSTNLLFELVPARQVVHWFEMDRPGQGRGIPKISAALPLFAQLRRIRLATLTAMEFASMLAGVMKTNLPPGTETAVAVDQWNLFELVRGALLTLPSGWEATQFRPEQPTANAETFSRDTLNEAGRGTGAPLNVVTGNSSQYNFSSGRLDHVPYQHGLRIDRDDFQLVVTDPVFTAWEEEARLWSMANPDLPPQVNPGLPPVEEWNIGWQWDGFGTIDPMKEAGADDINLRNCRDSLSGVLGEDGKDWQEHVDQLAREMAYCKAKGLPWPLYNTAPPPSPAAGASGAADLPPGPGSLEQMVELAMSDAGIGENTASEVLSALGPTFAEIRSRSRLPKPSRNGHHLAA